MTKAAVAVMVKGIAVDLAPRGITVNNIQPGPTLTDMTVGYIDSITPAIPLKRVGDPDEIAGLVAYLASGESGYMTGSSLTVDGGMALCAPRGIALWADSEWLGVVWRPGLVS
jgi:3-oxoacyl-[acyl-carrier protein] reductase